MRLICAVGWSVVSLFCAAPAFAGFDAARIGIPVVEVANAAQVLRGVLIVDNEGHVLGTIDDVACGWLDERVARVRVKLKDSTMAGRNVWLSSEVLRFDASSRKIFTRMNVLQVRAKVSRAIAP